VNLGYQVKRETYQVNGTDCYNLVVELPGRARGGEIVVVGAHYDSVPGTPGADDNASGVAACMNLAQSFAKSENERTLRFVFFANEEPPYFQTDDMGSLVYARGCKQRGEQIVGMLSLETMGYYSDAENSQKAPPGLPADVPSRGNFLTVAGNVSSAPLVQTIGSWFERNSTLPCLPIALPASTKEQGWSDHWSFWQMGYPAVMVTDTAVFRNPHYHQPSDTVDTLDYTRLTEAVAGLEGAISELVNPSRSGGKK
jgi:Zn-dependent M28 family amino/carboxypeptidase